MYVKQEDVFYYITIMNEFYKMPPMPKGVEEGILKGMYRYKASTKKSKLKANLFGSGTILNEVIKAGELLEKDYGVSADIWSITSYKELYMNGIETDRWNTLNADKKARKTFIEENLENTDGVYIAASDYVKALPESVDKWFPKKLYSLGTDGFGRSDGRAALRDFFEVDHRYIVISALKALLDEKKIKAEEYKTARKKLKLSPDKPFQIRI